MTAHTSDRLIANAATAEKEIRWLSDIIVARGLISFENNADQAPVEDIAPPDIAGDVSPYAAFIRRYAMNFAERFLIVLALVPHLRPELMDMLFVKNPATDRPFTELGGQKGASHNGYLPTGETAFFLIAGQDLKRRFELFRLFDEDHYFTKQGILKLEVAPGNEPRLSGLLTLSAEYLALLTTGETFKPDFSPNFPARRLKTGLEWADLVVGADVMDELEEIGIWLKHGQTLLHDWKFGKKIKAGYRVLFSGPPGTGKTLTASLLGKTAGMDVYRIDLSMVVSKFIGETEKNLAGVFDMAENKNWVLFFDEADALFGKRTTTSSSHDRHANQEVSYLLQRIEDYAGLVILATNFRSNLDEAFARRFQLNIEFQKPDEAQRLQLWKSAYTAPALLAPDVDLEKLAAAHEITGAAIMNVLRYSSLMALNRGTTTIQLKDIQTGIRKEFQKDGRITAGR